MNAAENSSFSAQVDAQFTNVKVLRPFANFETVYQGLAGNVPIMFPGVRDLRAGRPGFSPQLAEGIPIPFGSRIVLWIPMAFNPAEGAQNYRYRVVWRMQNLNSYREPGRQDEPRPPYHFAIQRPGAPDTTVGTQPRTIIPAGWRSVAFEQTEVAGADGQVNLRVEDLVVTTNDSLINVVRPVYADGSAAVLQQGILDPVTNPVGGPLPIFKPFWFDAEGDELMILVTRDNPAAAWDFTDPALDLAFSNVYGDGDGTHVPFQDLGIYMLTGTNP